MRYTVYNEYIQYKRLIREINPVEFGKGVKRQ